MDVRNQLFFFSYLFLFLYLGIQLIHNSANAASHEDANDGLIFIQEMMNSMKNTNGISQSSSESNQNLPLTVIPLVIPSLTKPIRFAVGSAQFGRQLHGKSGVNKSSF